MAKEQIISQVKKMMIKKKTVPNESRLDTDLKKQESLGK